MAPDPLARPPGLDGDPGLGIPGLSAIPRPQEGDAAVTASPGQELTFSRVGGVEEVMIDGASARLPSPFRALLERNDDVVIEARRADGTTWVVHRSLL